MASKRTNALRAREYMAIRAMTGYRSESCHIAEMSQDTRKQTMNLKLARLFAANEAANEVSLTAKVHTRFLVETKRVNALAQAEAVFGKFKHPEAYDYTSKCDNMLKRNITGIVRDGNESSIDDIRHSASVKARKLLESIEKPAASKKEIAAGA